ncbi:MAG: protein-export chaperone SecB [Gammaproteobacteria bacterium]|nr:protein-export chaperone SecB [Gammaproteobacteria bacterium]MDH5593132.1 protein-export chaperone SecB [Gammaproteobacteria bacterium]
MSEQEKAGGIPDTQFAIQRLYIKDVSFETPNSPNIFKENGQPEMTLNVASKSNKLDEKVFEVVLSLTVTVKMKEKTAYLVEVQQAGIFYIDNVPDEHMGPMLGSYCPNMLFPYAREVVSELVTKGSFPQLVLAPINFDALYLQQQQQAGQQKAH